MTDRTPLPVQRPRSALFKTLAIGLGLGVLVFLELGLRFSTLAPPTRAEWSREHGVISIEHYYSQFSEHFVVLGQGEEGPICGPSPEHTMHGSSEADAMQPDRFLCKKPDGVTRIAVLGGSSIQGFMLRDSQTIPSRLEWHLSKAGYPNVEVINAGVAGYNTLQLRRLLPELWTFEPDMLVVYAGHNDYTYYPAIEAALRASGALRATRGLGDKLATWRLLRTVARAVGVLPKPRQSTMDRYAGTRPQARAVFQVDPLAVPRSRAARRQLVKEQRQADENIAAFYEENLTWLDQEASIRGVDVLMVTPVARMEWKPSGSVHWKDLQDEELLAWEAIWKGTTQRAQRIAGGADPTRQQNLDPEQISKAMLIDDTFADLVFLAARAAHQQGRTEEAVQLYREAYELTPPTRSDRAPLRQAERVVKLARRLGRSSVDLRPVVDSNARTPGLPGQGLFLDGMHFSVRGADLAARAISEGIVEEWK